MKQILFVLLLIRSSISDKLDRSYLPSKPDPFNNGQISDTVLKSAAPLLPDSSKPNGGSFGTDAAIKKYLPPGDLGNQSKYAAINSGLTRPNDRFDEPSRDGYYQNLKISNGFPSTVQENIPPFGAQNGGFRTKDSQLTESSRGGQHTPSLNGNVFNPKVNGNKPQSGDQFTRVNEPSKVEQYTPNTNGIPSDVHDRSPNYDAGLTRGTLQFNEPPREGQYTPSSNTNAFTSKGVESHVPENIPAYGTQNGGTRGTERFTEAPRNGQYTPNSNGNNLRSEGVSSFVQESKPGYGIQNGGLTRGTEPGNSFSSKGVPSYVQQNKPEFGIQNGGLARGTEPSRTGQYTPTSNGNDFGSKGVPTHAQGNKPGYPSQNGGLSRGTEQVNEYPRDGQYTTNTNGNSFIPSRQYPDAGQNKPDNFQKGNEPNGVTGFPGSHDNHDSFGKYASNGQFVTPTESSYVGADASPSKAPTEYYRGEDIQPNFNNQAEILRSENNVNAGDGVYNYLYDTDNGIHVEEEGSGADQTKIAQGGYSYTSPEGEQIKVQYFADKDGYHPKGSHVPEIPDAILRSIEFNKAEEARGIKNDASNTDDGQYNGENGFGSISSSGSSSYSPNGPTPTPVNVQQVNDYAVGPGGVGYGTVESSGPSDYSSYQRRTFINTPSTVAVDVQPTNQYGKGPVGSPGPVGKNGLPLNGDEVFQKFEGPLAGAISAGPSSSQGYNYGKNSAFEPQTQKGNTEFSGTNPTGVKSNLGGFGTVSNTFPQKSYSSSNNQHSQFGQVNKDATAGQGAFNGYFDGGYQTERTDKFAVTSEIPLRDSSSSIFENNKYGTDSTIHEPERPSGFGGVPNSQGKNTATSGYHYGDQGTIVHNGGSGPVVHGVGHIDVLKGARQPIATSGILKSQSYQQTSEPGKFGGNDRLPENKPYSTHFDEKTGYKY